MLISKISIKPIYIQIVITFTLILIVSFIRWYENYSNENINLFILSWINNLAFIIQIRLHKQLFGKYVNPITFFTCFLFLFSSGQLILYSFGIEILGFNIFHRLDQPLLTNSILYIILGLSFYQLGVFTVINRKNIYINIIGQNNSKNNKPILMAGWLFFTIGVVPYLVYVFYVYFTVSKLGYSAYYKQEGIRLNNELMGLGYFLFTGLVLIVVGGKKSQKKFAIISLVLISLLRLASGDRGDGIVFILTSYMLYTFFIKQGKVKNWQLLIMSLILISLVPTIGVLRNNSEENFITLLIENNIVTSTLINLGGTIWPLAKVMELIPSQVEFTLGSSYLTSLLLMIPSFLRFGIVSEITTNNLHSSPANWLMNYLDMSYGPGFTPFAESYMNFGWIGIVAMGFYGLIIGKLLCMNAKNNKDIPLRLGLSILAFLFFAMAARGSFNYIISYYFRYILLPLLFIKLLQSKTNNNSS